MSSLARKGNWISGFCLCLLLWAVPAAWGQLSALVPKGSERAAEPVSGSAPSSAADLEKALAAANDRLRTYQALLIKNTPEQFGGTEEEATQKATLLARLVLAFEQHLMALNQLEDTRLAAQDLATKVEGWKGFSVSPPYSLSLLDELRDSIGAQKIQIEKDKRLIAFAEQEQDRGREALKVARKNRRQVMEMLERPAAAGAQLRRGWLDELSVLEVNVVQAEVLSAEVRSNAAEAALKLHSDKLVFLERQLQVAEASPAEFTQADLDRRLADIASQEKSLAAEQIRVSRESAQAEERLQHARQRLEQARVSATPPATIDLLQEDLDLRKAQAENIAMQVEFYKIRAIVLGFEKLVWEERFKLARGTDDFKLKEIEERLLSSLSRLEDYRSYINSNLTLTQKLALSQRQRLAGLPKGDPLRDPVNERLEVYRERGDFLLKALADIDDISRLNQRFLQEIQSRQAHAGLEKKLRNLVVRGWDLIRRLWTYEIFVAEDTILVEGQKVTKERPVTTGKVAVALAILLVGLWLVFMLRDRTRNLAARYLKLEADAAVLFEKVLTACVTVAVFAIALITVKIPLTVFAFMGGALAIGVGFGAQNLINNWISGMILLLERPIKVGDVIEIEGGRGRVVEIGARCSQVRRFDGFDLLVPNSEFLQKNVINLTLSDDTVRLRVRVGVAYGSPTREVARIMTAALVEHGRILDEPEPLVLFEDFGDSALLFSAYFWVRVSPSYDYRIIESDYRHMLDRRFAEAGITVAFPQLDVHLDGQASSPSPPEKEPAGNGKQLPANGARREAAKKDGPPVQ